MIEYLTRQTEIIGQYLPEALLAFAVAFLITPLIGKFARKYGFMDLPAKDRPRTDMTRDRRIHTTAIPKLGGVAVFLAFFAAVAFFNQIPTNINGVLLGMIVIVMLGVLDDKLSLSGKTQISFQLIAACLAVIAGISITDINISGHLIDFNLFSQNFDLLGFTYTFIFPADLITIAWILTVTNAIGWVCGIDALGESMTMIASVTFGALALKIEDAAVYAPFFFMYAGALFGFIPYNFPGAKIFSGTSGHFSFGFFLATMTVASGISGINAITLILILALPITDMIWVLIGRIKHNHIKSPMDLLSISDKTHLHHRIMNLGFSIKETLYIEMIIFSIYCMIAFYLGGRNTDVVLFSALIVTALIIFMILATLYKREWKKRKAKQAKRKHTITKESTPEQKYAY